MPLHDSACMNLQQAAPILQRVPIPDPVIPSVQDMEFSRNDALTKLLGGKKDFLHRSQEKHSFFLVIVFIFVPNYSDQA
jgi:hypothetical protein